MRAVVAFATLSCAAMGLVRAAEVRVVDPSGNPVPNVAVICLGSESGVGSTGADGLARVPDRCRRVHCEIRDFLPAQAAIVNGRAECRLAQGVAITAAPLPKACAGEHGCHAAVIGFGGGVSEGDWERTGVPDLPEWRKEPEHFRFKLVPPGRYRLRLQALVGETDMWVCEADVGTLAAGEQRLTTFWRDPAPVRVRAPRAGLTVVVGRRLDRADRPGDGHCSRYPNPPIETRADGTAEGLVDPAHPFVLELHEPGRDAPVARREFDALPEGEVVFQF